MKHLRKFNENLVYKEPLDVEHDVEKFQDLFKSEIGRHSWRTQIGEYYSMQNDLDRIKSDNPTMSDEWDVWGVYKNSDRVVYCGYARAISEEHARLKLATNLKLIDIFSFKYSAKKLSKEDIEGIIDSYEHEIYLIKNPI